MEYSHLPQLNPSSRHWVIYVRISRLWHYRRGSDDGPIDHTDLVLLNEHSNHIYAEIGLDHVSRFQPLLQEQKIYELRKFIVSPPEKTYKPVQAPYMIWFTRHTLVQEKNDMPENFSLWTYNPVPFRDLPMPSNSPEYFIDVTAIITAISEVEYIQTTSRPTISLKRTVMLRDISSEICLDMWGECATRFDAQTILAAGQKEPIIAIFVGTLTKIFKGQTTLSASSACRWYTDSSLPEIQTLRRNIHTHFEPVQPIITATHELTAARKHQEPEHKIVKELLELDLFEYENTNFMCTVTIIRLTQGQRWWFPSCQLCHRSATPDKTSYICTDPNCTSRDAEPKYKISLIATDDTDEAEFILFGKIGQHLVRKPLISLLRANRPRHESTHDVVRAARAEDTIPTRHQAQRRHSTTFNRRHCCYYHSFAFTESPNRTHRT